MKIPLELLSGIILIDFTIFGASSSYPFEKDFFDLCRFKINSYFYRKNQFLSRPS